MGPELLDNLEILETMEELDLMVNVENREGTGEKDNLEMQVGVVLEVLQEMLGVEVLMAMFWDLLLQQEDLVEILEELLGNLVKEVTLDLASHLGKVWVDLVVDKQLRIEVEMVVVVDKVVVESPIERELVEVVEEAGVAERFTNLGIREVLEVPLHKLEHLMDLLEQMVVQEILDLPDLLDHLVEQDNLVGRVQHLHTMLQLLPVLVTQSLSIKMMLEQRDSLLYTGILNNLHI